MLTQKEALSYDEQLHPAFAGYLHDGSITERDALATIFHLLTKGILNPVWHDGSMLKTLEGAKRTKRKSVLPINNIIVEEIFREKEFVSTKEIGNLIKTGEIQKVIKENLHAISAFPIINEELKFTLGKRGIVKFSVNGNPVDTIQEATTLRKILYKVLLPIFLGVGGLLLVMSLFLKRLLPNANNYSYQTPTLSIQVQGNGDSGNSLLLTGGILMGFFLFFFFTFVFSKKTITYDFKDKVIPVAKKKYDELYEFIKQHPLPEHRFINEFLAFSIAFGFDDSWNKDFGLDKEIKVDRVSLNSETM